MRQQVAKAVNAISSTKREKSAKPSPKSQLFNVIFFSFLGGMLLADGLHDFRAKSGNHWAFDLAMAAAWLILATAMGIRLLRVDKARGLAADANSVLRVTDASQP